MKRLTLLALGSTLLDCVLSFNLAAAAESGSKLVAGSRMALTAEKSAAAEPEGSSFTPPPPNACQSRYDEFYRSEPGVYAYWALCETGSNPSIYDYAGSFDFDSAHSAWQRGAVEGHAPGPVDDKETALQITASKPGNATAQNLPVNRQAGTIAAWVNSMSLATSWMAVPFAISAVNGKSSVALLIYSDKETVCFGGGWQNDETTSLGASTRGGVWSPAARCGFAPNTWHRVVETWTSGYVHIYIDGSLAGKEQCRGALDNRVFFYQLFPVPSGVNMALAKALVSNQAWSAVQVSHDFSPAFMVPPTGGVFVTNQQLGAIHRDVLGYADNNSDLSFPGLVSALTAGLRSAGVTALRYGNGFGGIEADLEDWRGGNPCTSKPGVTAKAQNVTTANKLDTYIPQVAQRLGLHVGFTVNYGTNPPSCNAGGDPRTNGANLVDYANNKKHYGIKYWEIGNEIYDGKIESDFHANPNTGDSYARNESDFYADMKAQDSTISIGIPIAGGVYDWLTNYTLPVLAKARYDAVVFHSYPMKSPISDGATLYQDRVAANIGRTRGALLAMETMLLNVGKPLDAIWVTEWNADVNGGRWSRQTMGAVMPIFATVQLAEYMRAGVRYATWWTQGMSAACMKYFYDRSGETAYSWLNCGGLPLTYTGPVTGEAAVGFKPGDITPVARAFQLLSQSGFVTEGEHTLETFTDSRNAPWLLSYAATHEHGRAVVLINRDPDHSHIVPVAIEGMAAGARVTQWTYGRAEYDQSRYGNWRVEPVKILKESWSGVFNSELPPWSVSVIVLPPAGQ